MKTHLVTFAITVMVSQPVWAKDASYIGSVETVPSKESVDAARGTVFIDANRNSKFDDDETGLEGVSVSNGREVVLTDSEGKYELPAYDDMNLFITKPHGYVTPVSEEMVPQFAYVHKLAGSPPLRFGGIEATGPLPSSINFPLVEDTQDETFECLVFGDAQPYTSTEIGYVRETAGNMLANRDNSETDCLIFAGDVMGDDLSLYPRFKEIIAVGGVPQYFVGGNHDLDFDAEHDDHSFDTFRREWGPEYYSFDIGNVHFVGLDNVRYPCNGVDPHPFCAEDKSHTYNGVLSKRQLTWLKNDLEHVPQDKLIVLVAHIPFVTFTDNDAAKHQTDNLNELYEVIGDRPALGLTGHTHTTENIEPGENFEGWQEHTGTGPVKFHQIVTGALSGSWWAGDLNLNGVPHSTQRLGSPRGYYQLNFNGSDYVETFNTFTGQPHEQMHASLNSPRYRVWAERLFAYRELYPEGYTQNPPVTLTDLGDLSMVTTDDLANGTWVAINVWNGSRSSVVEVSINGASPMTAERTQKGDGEAKLRGIEHSDPLAIAKQSTQGRVAWRSVDGGYKNAGFTTWQGVEWHGRPGPFAKWMLTDSSQHLWRADLPKTLPLGVHTLNIKTTDRHGREFTLNKTFEVVDELPIPGWDDTPW
ncbi:MAG: calcineurin-like phosphoesterase family protein [Granulosicoccus sp.]|nr:calcineurin-like phosphoesterase family protein [Granulosicoccus sp.]